MNQVGIVLTFSIHIATQSVNMTIITFTDTSTSKKLKYYH